MSPQSASRGPVERVYVECIHCPDTEQLAASVDGLGRTYDDFCLIFGILSWLMPIRDRSGQAGLTRFIGTCWSLSFSVVHASTSPTKRLALNTDIGGDAHRRTCYFHFPFSEMARG